MPLVPEKRALEGVISSLLQPFLEDQVALAGWRLINWDVEQAICLTFERGGITLLLELERRNEALDCYERTRRFNVCVRKLFGDEPLSDSDRAFVDSVLAIVREREAGLFRAPRPEASAKRFVREILVDRLLMREGRDQYYINPYVGCMIACPFCYVIDRADFSRELEGLPRAPWGHYLDVKINAAEVLRREVRDVASGIVRMSPILTDPYQGAEHRYRVTRQCLEVLVETEIAPVILTRAPRILEDVELLQRFRRVLVGFSIPTDNDEMRRIFEPNSDPIEDRIRTLRALHAAGVRTFAVIQPVLPMSSERLVDLVAPYVCAVRLDRLYVGERIRHIYDRHELTAFATDEYASRTIAELTARFEERGVRVDNLDDFGPLLGP